MKESIRRIIISSFFSSSLGCLALAIFMLLKFLEYGFKDIQDILGSIIIFYLSAVVVSCLMSMFIAGPIYLLLNIFKLANYFTAFGFGMLIMVIWFGIPDLSISMGWHLTGGMVGLLFHYQYKNLFT